MITATGEKIKIEGIIGDAMSEAVQIVQAITDIVWVSLIRKRILMKQMNLLKNYQNGQLISSMQ